ncbi:MAG: hypothetical protein R3C62_10710 [Chloroflexota bacterium]
MEQIIIHIKDKQKARRLFDLLAVLDFVDSVETSEMLMEREVDTDQINEDFFALAGLWQGRDISQETIRQQAWPRQ